MKNMNVTEFRHQFSDALISEYKEGIARSFDYLRKDKEALENSFETSLYIERAYILSNCKICMLK